jgi:TonB family protein
MSLRLNVGCFVIALTTAACSSPPTAEIDAARSSRASATTAGAEKFAPDAFKEAQAAETALEAELKAQDDKWVKSYDRARELAVAAKTAADKAATEAANGRERAVAETARREKAEKAAAARRAKLASAVRVGGQIRPPIKMKDVPPVYPAVAQSARVSGDVVIEATVDEEGKVADARVVKSVPLLDQAALDAVRQWEYRPSLLNGIPTPVVVTVTVRFTRP